MQLGKLDSYIKKKHTGLVSHTLKKQKTKKQPSKWIKELNVRPET